MLLMQLVVTAIVQMYVLHVKLYRFYFISDRISEHTQIVNTNKIFQKAAAISVL